MDATLTGNGTETHKTKKAAIAAIDASVDILRAKKAGRLSPSGVEGRVRAPPSTAPISPAPIEHAHAHTNQEIPNMLHLTEAFVETFTATAKAALARYPQDASRLHQACLMVLDGAVTLPETGGDALVQSRSIPGRTHKVNGICQCQGAQHGITRCAHRYAVSLLRHTLTALTMAEAHHLPEGGYSVPERERRAAAGDRVATVVTPEWRQAQQDAGKSVEARR